MGHFLTQEKKTSEQTDTQLERQTVNSPAGCCAERSGAEHGERSSSPVPFLIFYLPSQLTKLLQAFRWDLTKVSRHKKKIRYLPALGKFYNCRLIYLEISRMDHNNGIN